MTGCYCFFPAFLQLFTIEPIRKQVARFWLVNEQKCKHTLSLVKKRQKKSFENSDVWQESSKGNKWFTNLGDLGLLNFPIDANPATSNAEMAARVEVLAEVSTYIKALICWLKVNACSGLMGALPCLDKLNKISRFCRKSDWQPTRIIGVEGATARISGHQWFKALKRDEGSVIL